ncbi:MAG: hypothetical protein GXP51_00365 [Deltaproteobacteria bacterium]|nr:hypothetical protein [Deltaproteobacteria bacterium]
MPDTDENVELTVLHNKASFQIDGLSSEIHADKLCTALLKEFHRYLLHERKLDPLDAGSQAVGADYFLREFMIGHRRENIYNGSAEQARKFAGHWYIITTLEPNIKELAAILKGTASFYQYCAEYKLVGAERRHRLNRLVANWITSGSGLKTFTQLPALLSALGKMHVLSIETRP